jgi:hypothetical protein
VWFELASSFERIEYEVGVEGVQVFCEAGCGVECFADGVLSVWFDPGSGESFS